MTIETIFCFDMIALFLIVALKLSKVTLTIPSTSTENFLSATLGGSWLGVGFLKIILMLFSD